MKIAIRADGGSKIGMGHIMRTLVLAKELAKTNEIVYICRYSECDKNRYVQGIKKVIDEGFSVIEVNELNLIEDLCKVNADCLITDSYEVNEEYFNITRKIFSKTIYIDDLNLYFYNVDMIINPNAYANEFKYKCKPSTRKLLGSKYVMLREEFRNNKEYISSKDIRRILITVGGTDNNFVTDKVLQYISDLEYQFNVVIGPAFINKDYLIQKYKLNSNIIFHENANMYEVISSSDLVISACGTTIYELVACKKPVIGLVIVDNQQKASDYLAKNKCIKTLGWHNSFSKKDICLQIHEISKNDKLKENMIERFSEIVDINGVVNVSSEINSLINI